MKSNLKTVWIAYGRKVSGGLYVISTTEDYYWVKSWKKDKYTVHIEKVVIDRDKLSKDV